MAYDAGSIINTTPLDKNTVAGTVSDKIQNLCGGSGVANWSFLENIPAGTGAGQTGSASYSVDVYKCAGSGTNANSAGVDWFFGIGCVSTAAPVTAPVACLVAEVYKDIAGNPVDADRGKFKGVAPIPGNTTPSVTTFRFSDAYQTYAACSKTATWAPSSLSGTGFSYWIKLTHDSLFLSTLNFTAEQTVFAGLMNSFVSPDPYPLVTIGNSSGGFTSLPQVSVNGSAGMWGAGQNPWTYNVASAQGGEFTNPTDLDFWQSGRAHVARMVVGHNTALQSTLGGFRGLLPADYLGIQTGGLAIGDTVDIGGTPYVVISTDTSGVNTANTPATIIAVNVAWLTTAT